MPKDLSKEKGASQSQVLVLATLPFTAKEDPKGHDAAKTKEDPKGKGATQKKVQEVPTLAKANLPPPKTT